jgi:hypothetical protein
MGNMYGVGSQSAQVGAALRVKPWRRLLVAALPALLVLSACGKKEDAPKPAEPTQSKPAASAADTVGKKVLRIAFVVGGESA